MRPARSAPSTRRLAALLLVLSLSWLVAGCGGDDGGSDSDSSDSSSSTDEESSSPSEPETSESEDAEAPSEGSEGSEGSGSDAELQGFIAGCKQGVDQQIAGGTVPEDLRDELEALCDTATGAGPEEVERLTLETCVIVATGTSGVSEDEARTRCEAGLS